MSIDLSKAHEIVTPIKPNGYLSNLAPGITVWHDGSPTESGTAVTSAYVTIAASTGDITFHINGTTNTDDRIGSSGAIDVSGASYDTYKQIYDHINSVQGWYCRLDGVLPSTAAGTENALNELAQTSCYKRAVACPIDTAGIDKHGLCISNRRYATVRNGHSGNGKLAAIEDEHGAINRLYYLWLTATDAGTGLIKIYSVGPNTCTTDKESNAMEEIQLFHIPSSATTVETKLDFLSHPITAKPGHHLVIEYSSSDAVSAVTECFALGKSILPSA